MRLEEVLVQIGLIVGCHTEFCVKGRLFKDVGERREDKQRLRVEARSLFTVQERSAVPLAFQATQQCDEAERPTLVPTRLPFAQTTLLRGIPKQPT
jgi:hypothetical protein